VKHDAAETVRSENSGVQFANASLRRSTLLKRTQGVMGLGAQRALDRQRNAR
jgi:hypothetical protein